MNMLSKSDLLNRIRTDYEALLAALRAGKLKASDGSVDHNSTAWTAKDILAHITAWEQVLLDFHIGGQSFDEVIKMAGAKYHVTSFDDINAHLYGTYQNWSWQQVEELASEVHAALMSVLENLPEEMLQTPAESIAAIGLDPYPLYEYIAANTFDHYNEHLDNLTRN